MSLKVDFCTFEAAQFAVKQYHYSKSMPSGGCVKLGVWEDGVFIGAVIFGKGANDRLLSPYGLHHTEGCELTRVALSKHKAPVTQIVAIALRILKKTNPGLRLVVSFADSRQGHEGTIYKAGNWVYTGKVHSTPDYLIDGKWKHQRSVTSKYGTIKGIYKNPAIPYRDGGYRHRFLMPLDDEMRVKIEPLRLIISVAA